eukprot:COSAG02_NODE_986_length_15452_cov_17.818602_6_plen_133_part_00
MVNAGRYVPWPVSVRFLDGRRLAGSSLCWYAAGGGKGGGGGERGGPMRGHPNARPRRFSERCVCLAAGARAENFEMLRLAAAACLLAQVSADEADLEYQLDHRNGNYGGFRHFEEWDFSTAGGCIEDGTDDQ